MITQHELRQIVRLNSQGLSTRAIARELGVSRETVRRALRGEIEPREIAPAMRQTSPRRCDGCGAMVYLWPCLTCARTRRA